MLDTFHRDADQLAQTLRQRVGELERAEVLLAGENRLLEMVATGRPLAEILAALCRLIEELSTGCMCGILLVDATGKRLEHGAAPSLPSSYSESIHGRPVNTDSGPCAMAACLGKQVIAADVATDNRWESYAWCPLALLHGLRSCWSTPIISATGSVRGTFAIYWREARSPTVQDQKLIEQTTHLAAVAIERDRTESALRASENYVTEAIDTIPGLVWSVLPDGEVDFINQRWREYTGLTLAQARGRGWTEAIHPDDLARLDAYWKSVLASGKPGEIEARLRRFDGTFRWFLFRAVPLYDDAGKLVKWYGQNTDIDDRKRMEEELRRSEVSLARAQRLSSTGSFSFRVATGEITLSEETYRIYEFPTYLKITPEMARDRVHPDDIEGFRQMLFGQNQDFSFECRLLMPDGGVKHLEIIASAVRDGSGLTAEWVGAVRDITERRKAAEALRASEHLARGQLEALASSLAALSRESVPEKFLEHVLRIAAEQLEAVGVSVWEMNEHLGCVELAANYQDRVLYLPDKTESQPPPRMAGGNSEHPVWTEFFRTGKHCVYGTIENGPPWSEVAIHPDGPWYDWRAGMVDNPIVPQMIKDVAASGIVATLNVPMLVSDKVAGLFVLCFKMRRAFRPDEIELTRAMANQAMLAIKLMRLSQANRESAVIAERNRMARDLHDTLAQGFTGVIMQLEAAQGIVAKLDLPEAASRIERAAALARASLSEARRSVRALRPRSLYDQTLAVALDHLFRQMSADSQLHAAFFAEGEEYALSADWDENLLRITQEALTNTMKHAKAANFRATLKFRREGTELRLSDDGCGFDVGGEHEGFGLIGIKERVERMAGKLTIRSEPGKGTEILIHLNRREPTKIAKTDEPA